jgi:peptide deformylase
MHVDPADIRIVLYPDPVLKERARPVEEIDDTVRAVAARMIELMHEAPGVGLAAPQVGLPWRMFVTHAGEADPVDRVFVNPELTLGGELVSAEEGCLSLPEINVQVRRPDAAEITATDADGQTVHMRGEGFLARVWQHEFDHLNGVLIVDRMSPMDRLATRRALKDLRAAAAG